MQQHIRLIAEKYQRIDAGRYKLIDRKTKNADRPDIQKWINEYTQKGYKIVSTIYYK